MDDKQILHRVTELVDQEHTLRTRHLAGELDDATERSQLKTLEEELDQCWDLLRRRRALRESGADPDTAEPRPVGEVEGYLQ